MSEKAMRFNKGKPKLSFMLDAPNAMEAFADACERGMLRGYPRGNWKKGLPYTEVIDSLMRHLVAFNNGKDVDDGPEGTGLHHAKLILWNAAVLAEMVVAHPELDDRVCATKDKIKVSSDSEAGNV